MICTSRMVASFSASKKSSRMRPRAPILPMTRPNTAQNTMRPSTLIPSEYEPVILYSLVTFCQAGTQDIHSCLFDSKSENEKGREPDTHVFQCLPSSSNVFSNFHRLSSVNEKGREPDTHLSAEAPLWYAADNCVSDRRLSYVIVPQSSLSYVRCVIVYNHCERS